MPNPSGHNQFNRYAAPSRPAGPFTPEPGYGEKKRQGDLERLAPAPALNAPERAHDRAKRRSRPAPQQAPATAAPPVEVQPLAVVAEFWRALADEVDDPLIREYANEF